MNKVFAAKLPNGSTGLSEGDGQGMSLAAFSRAPGTIPSHVNPPHPSDNLLLGSPEEPKIAVATSSAAPTRVANAAPPEQSEGLFSSLARKMGLGGASAADTTASAPPPAAAPTKKLTEAKSPRPEGSIPKAKSAETRQAARPPLKPSISDQPAAATADAPPPTAPATLPAPSRSCRPIHLKAASRR